MYHLLGLPRSLPVLPPLVIPMQMPQELAPWGYSGLPGATFVEYGKSRPHTTLYMLGATWGTENPVHTLPWG